MSLTVTPLKGLAVNATHALNSHSTTPVWFCDLDGVINAFLESDVIRENFMYGNEPSYKRYNLRDADGKVWPLFWRQAVIDFMNDVHRAGLAEIVWLTTWTNTAVTDFSPLAGLDAFEAVLDMEGGEHSWHTDWWKWRRVRDYLGDNDADRAVVWTDDDLSASVKDAFRYRYDPDGTRSCLLNSKAHLGLSDENLATIRAFLEAQRG